MLKPSHLSPLSLALLATFASHAALAQQSDPTQLDRIVVTASGFEQQVEDAPASITVLPREELQKRSYKDITDALKDVPGVVITGGGSSSDISIRGMSSAYTLILVDGRRMNSRETRPNSDNSGIEQGWLPPLEAIDRIEVVRGPMSSLYGSEAMGGVINIITRKVARDWNGSLRLESTIQEDSKSGNINQGNFYLSGPLQDDLLGLEVWGQKSHRNEDKFINGFNKQDTTSGTVKLSLTPTRDHDIVAEFGKTRQERTSTPGKSSALESCRSGGCTPNSISESKYDRSNWALSHFGRYGDWASETYIQQDKTDNPGRKMYLKNQEFNTKWNLATDTHMVTFGVQYLKEKLDDEGNQYKPSVSHLSRYRWSAYAEDEWSITQNFILTGGLRFTKDENYGNHWTPRIYGIWKLNDQFNLKGGVSTGFKAPALRAAVADWGQITGGGGVPAVIVGNPDLKPEKSVTQELGFTWDNRENMNFGLTVYNTEFKDKISEVRRCTDPNGDPTCHVEPGDIGYKFISDRINIDKATMRGVEATWSWDVLDNLQLINSYTYTHSKQKSGEFKGKPLNKMPKHMFNTTLDYNYTEQLNMWGRMNLRSKTSEYQSRTTMAEGTPGFGFFDVGMNYAFNKKVRVGAGVYNLFDKRVTDETHGAVYDGRRYGLQLTVGF